MSGGGALVAIKLLSPSILSLRKTAQKCASDAVSWALQRKWERGLSRKDPEGLAWLHSHAHPHGC